MTDLFVFAAEPSADLHGEKLLKALFEKKKDLSVIGVGGPRMRAQGLNCIMPMENFLVMGFVDVIAHLPSLIKHFFRIRNFILKQNPKACVFIDYPGFNLRMERSLRKKGYKGKLIHYICPSVWAWGKKRIPIMEQNLDLLLSILPFEKELFDPQKIRVEYVGNPLITRIKEYNYKPLSLDKKVIAVFPGSRKKEIERNFPLQLQALKSFPEYQIAVSVSNPSYQPLIESLLQQYNIKATLISADYTYELMKGSTLALAKSGTVILELGLHGTPTVVTYAISPLDTFAVKYIFRINLPFYTLPNILCKKELFPELMGPNCTVPNIVSALKRLETQKPSCLELKTLLQDKDASANAAILILNQIEAQ